MFGLAAWTGALAWLYGPVLVGLARQWRDDSTYSHGWVIAPLALMLAWRQRQQFRAAARQPSTVGLAIVIASLAVFVGGTLAAELFLTRVSLIGVVAGSVLYGFGRTHFRLLAFPIAFLIFMIPLPAILFDRVAVSLQLVASALGEQLLRSTGVAVLRDGNLLRLASVTLEVNDACSGIRSLMALVAVTTLAGYLFEPNQSRRVAVAAAAVPLAIGLNAVRITATGLAALRFGPWAASGAVHEATGAVVFVAAIACVCAVHLVRRGRIVGPQLEIA